MTPIQRKRFEAFKKRIKGQPRGKGPLRTKPVRHWVQRGNSSN